MKGRTQGSGRTHTSESSLLSTIEAVSHAIEFTIYKNYDHFAFYLCSYHAYSYRKADLLEGVRSMLDYITISPVMALHLKTVLYHTRNGDCSDITLHHGVESSTANLPSAVEYDLLAR